MVGDENFRREGMRTTTRTPTGSRYEPQTRTRRGTQRSQPECRFEREDCHAWGDGRCAALIDTDFSTDVTDCPFYRSKQDNLRENTACLNKLIRMGRTDLIDKYHPVYMNLSLLGGEDDFIRDARAQLEEKKQEIRAEVEARARKVSAISEEWYE